MHQLFLLDVKPNKAIVKNHDHCCVMINVINGLTACTDFVSVHRCFVIMAMYTNLYHPSTINCHTEFVGLLHNIPTDPLN